MCHFCLLHRWPNSWHLVLYLYLQCKQISYTIYYSFCYICFYKLNESIFFDVLPKLLCERITDFTFFILKIKYWWLFHFSRYFLKPLWQVNNLDGEFVSLSVRSPLKVLRLLHELMIRKEVETFNFIISSSGYSLCYKNNKYILM